MRIRHVLLSASFVAIGAPALAYAPQTPAATPLVTGQIDDTDTVALAGDLSSQIAVSADQGRIDDNLALPHVQVLLKRPAARQAALDAFVKAQLVPGSPAFHRWVEPAELADAFGPSQQDVGRVTAWLASHGLAVNSVSPDGMVIDVRGTAGALQHAFHTEIHQFAHNGESHIANIREPAIPRALQDVVRGVGLHNFFPKPNLHVEGVAVRDLKNNRTKSVLPGPDFITPVTQFGQFQLLGPNDFAVIYNVLPARAGSPLIGPPLTGLGATVAVLDDSAMLPRDWQRFRKVFGLSGYKGTLTLQNPGSCGNPGVTSAEGEAAVDAEWAGAAAPDANIIQASCPSTLLTFGVYTALEALVSYGTPAQLVSVSYGSCEAAYGPTFLAMWEAATEEAAAEGISVFVSAGDGGSDGCDNFHAAQYSTSGLSVNGLASNPYVTALGGTDFYDVALGESKEYFADKNRKGLVTALSYVPEMAWNNSCASPVLQQYELAQGKTTATNPLAFCNSADGQNYLDIGGGSGGASSVYPKPDWQSLDVYGVPNDGVRDLPDVSLFSAIALWGHGLLFCFSDPRNGGVPCDYNNPSDVVFQFAGGTSFAAPSFAGIMALATELLGVQQGVSGAQRIGNVAPRLYQLAAGEFSSGASLALCNATRGNKIGTACIFNNITANSNSVPCLKGTPDCFTNAESTQGLGVLSANPKGNGTEAYLAHPGWSFTNGVGSVNATNLLSAYFFY